MGLICGRIIPTVSYKPLGSCSLKQVFNAEASLNTMYKQEDPTVHQMAYTRTINNIATMDDECCCGLPLCRDKASTVTIPIPLFPSLSPKVNYLTSQIVYTSPGPTFLYSTNNQYTFKLRLNEQFQFQFQLYVAPHLKRRNVVIVHPTRHIEPTSLEETKRLRQEQMYLIGQRVNLSSPP